MMKQNSQRRTGIILAAALAALSSLTLIHPASAQYPAQGQDGHAHDANTRVGSGGYNAGRSNNGIVTGNDIADRNVTGGRGFTGPLGERDPRAFTGPAPSGLDLFNKQGNAASNSNLPGNNGQAVPYYGDNRFVAPPSGSIPLGFNGGYIGTTLNTPASLSSGYNVTPNDTSLQSRTIDSESQFLNQALRSPNYAAELNALNQSGILNASGSYGVLNTLNTTNFSPLSLPDMNPDEMSTLRMRDELRQSAPSSLNGIPNGLAKPQSDQGQNPTPSNALNQPLGQGFDAPTNSAISTRVNDAPLNAGQLSQTGNIPMNASGRSPLLPPATEQSSLLADLQRRLEESGEVGKTLVGNQPLPTAAKPRVKTDVKTPSPDQAPVPVSSLANGVTAKGLHDLLASSEDMIRQGKYDSAILQYNQAFRVASNNPLPILGRAHAELAGGYYARAEMDFRLIFRNDPELLLAQFDLKALFPKDRIDYIRKDLHALAENDPKSDRPWFLLAYLDYNTADAITADKDLAEAEQRAGRGDWSIKLLRAHWILPSNPNPQPLTPKTTPAPAKLPAAAPSNGPALAPGAGAPAPAPAPALNK